VWHRSPVRDEYYYGVFVESMPDLNYEHPAARDEAKKVARFWLEEMGVDGFRLDAVPYLVEEGDRLAHTAGTHSFLRDYSAFIRGVAPGAFTIGEVWDSTGAILPYYPDQLDAYFAFDVSEAILETVRTGSTERLFPAVERFEHALPPERWSPFLRNHDQTRTLTALGGDVARARVAATLLLTLPGLPFVYYGEEIGMTGDKPDPRLRTPMQWSRAPHAGFSRAVPWEPLQPDSLTANVAAEEVDPHSLLNWYRRLIHLRAANAALAAGELVPLVPSSKGVAAYLRRGASRTVLVIVNLGTASLTGLALSSEDRALAPGRYVPENLVGGPSAAPLEVGQDGRIQGYMPLGTLGPMESALFELSGDR
jgi:glycosidase